MNSMLVQEIAKTIQRHPRSPQIKEYGWIKKMLLCRKNSQQQQTKSAII